MDRMCARVFGMLAVAAGLSLQAQGGCPEINRLGAPITDGQLSLQGGGAPFGVRGADDFQLELGDGNPFNVRTIKFTMLANFTLSASNVRFDIREDALGGTPQRSVPGAIVGQSGNVVPSVVQVGTSGAAIDGRTLRNYEVTFAIPAGTLQLAAGRRYWLSPYALGTSALPGAIDVAYVAVNRTAPIVGEVANTSSSLAIPPFTYTTWTRISDGCCLGTADFAMFVDAVQVGRPTTDYTCDGLISVADIFTFLNAWFMGGPEADYNGAGGLSVSDIFDYLNDWFAGV